MITPTEEQNRALRAISDWYKNSKKQYFYLAGYAGTGKTAIAKLAVDACGINPDGQDVVYATFTGKASLVMRSNGMPATTIHQLIYIYDGEDDEGNLLFRKAGESSIQSAKLVVIDEVSMVDTRTANDLFAFGKKILVLGDPAQLDPPKASGFFTNQEPDFFLTEIHRQALENPIIRYAHVVREGGNIPYGDHGSVRKISFEDCSKEEFRTASQILVGKNKTRIDMNAMMLQIHGHPLWYPTTPDIKLICLRNYYDYGLTNGTIFKTSSLLTNDVNIDKRVMSQEIFYDGWEKHDRRRISMFIGEFEEVWNPRSKMQIAQDKDFINETFHQDGNRIVMADFGYAITVHKSQGSQYNNVILYDDNFLVWDKEPRKKWLYTAITRAIDTVTIVV